MKSKLFAVVQKFIIPLLFWLFLWQLGAILVSNSFLLPGIPETLCALCELLSDGGFYSAVLLSAVRVILGLAIGIAVGIIMAILCHESAIARSIFTPFVRVVKSTPVASFIVVLWVLLSGEALSVFIGFLMVMPIIYQNVCDGLLSIDKELLEVALVFEFSREKTFKLITLPAVMKYLIPGIITASGLCWKAEIAAEIIAYTKHSIGQGINDAKFNMDTPTVFAWTLIIILLSIGLESLTSLLLRRAKK